MGMDWGTILPMALAAGATVASGGTAAPALAGTLGATEGALGVAGAAEAAAAAEAATAAANAGAAAALPGAAAPAATMPAAATVAGGETAALATPQVAALPSPQPLPGNALGVGGSQAPSGWDAILNPLGQGSAAPGAAPGLQLGGNPAAAGMNGGSGITGGGGLGGNISGAAGTTPGMELQGGLGSGISGTPATGMQGGLGSTAPGGVGPTKLPFTPDQMMKLNNLVNGGGGHPQQQQRAPAVGAGMAPPNRAPTNMAQFSAPGQAARPTLSQLLYGQR
jgi:hypothetical protein